VNDLRSLAGLVCGVVVCFFLIGKPGMAHESITRSEGAELVGTPSPDWDVTDWINSPPLSRDDLKGRVVLVRWWTGPDCPYCRSSAPALERWHETYARHGLTVLGFYHHKAATPLTRAHVEALVRQYGLRFPVAVDPRWRTLRRWWLDEHERGWTSVSFLLDRNGVIRLVHPGGTYSRSDARRIEAKIRELLAEPVKSATQGSRASRPE
jgi:thiol-disulfide isomerase/thioredoxin